MSRAAARKSQRRSQRVIIQNAENLGIYSLKDINSHHPSYLDLSSGGLGVEFSEDFEVGDCLLLVQHQDTVPFEILWKKALGNGLNRYGCRVDKEGIDPTTLV